MAFNFRQTVASPFNAAVSGFMQGQQLDRQRQAQASNEQLALAMNELINNPNRTSEDVFQVAALLPESHAKGLLASFDALEESRKQDTLGFGSRVLASLQSGSPDIAQELLERRALAAENSGNDQQAKAWRDWARIADSNPDAAFMAIATQMAPLPGGKEAIAAVLDVREDQRKGELQPAAIAKAAAELKLTDAQTARSVQEAKATEARIRKINEEAGKIALESQKLKMELGSDRLIKLTAAGEKLVNDGAEKAVLDTIQAQQFARLADQMELEVSTAGITADLSEKLKNILGGEDGTTSLRQEYLRLRNSAALQMLPPGVASDKDIEIALGAFPDENARPELISSFLRGMAKLKEQEAVFEEAKSRWVNRVGNLGEASRPQEIMGINVVEGETFNDFARAVLGQDEPINTVTTFEGKPLSDLTNEELEALKAQREAEDGTGG